MEGSSFSLVRSRASCPTLGRGATFEMTDLLLFAFGDGKGLNPLGGA